MAGLGRIYTSIFVCEMYSFLSVMKRFFILSFLLSLGCDATITESGSNSKSQNSADIEKAEQC